MSYRVELSRQAQTDIRMIYAYIREQFVFVATIRHAARLELKRDELDELL